MGASIPFSDRAQRPPAMLRRVGAPVVLGSNALAAYAASVLLFAFLLKPWQADLVRPLDRLAGAAVAAVAYAAVSVVVVWALAEWLYRRRIFVKV